MLLGGPFAQVAVGEIDGAHDWPADDGDAAEWDPIVEASNEEQIPPAIQDDEARKSRFGWQPRRIAGSRRFRAVQLEDFAVERGLKLDEVLRGPPSASPDNEKKRKKKDRRF